MPTEPTPGRDTEGAAEGGSSGTSSSISSRPTPGSAYEGNTDEGNTGDSGTGAGVTRVADTVAQHQKGNRRGAAKGRDSAESRSQHSTSGRRSKQSESAVDPYERQQLVALGARIRQLRHARGYKSQMAFVLEAGLPRSYYGDIERGQTNPTMKTLLDIAKALNVPLADLFVPPGEVPLAGQLQEHGSGEAVATTASSERRPPATSAPRQSMEPFSLVTAQVDYRLSHPKLYKPRSHRARTAETEGWSVRSTGSANKITKGMGTAGRAGETEAAPGDQAAQLPTRARRIERGGTLISTALAARAFGVNIRTIERWVDAGKLLAWDWVDNRQAVFNRQEIDSIASEYHEYQALERQLRSAENALDTRAAKQASAALKRLLKRHKYKPQRARPSNERGSGGANGSGRSASERD